MRLQFRARAASDTKGVWYEVVYVLALWALIIIDFADHLGCMVHRGPVAERSAPVSLLFAVETYEVCAATLTRGVIDSIWVWNCVAGSSSRLFIPPWGVGVVPAQCLLHLIFILSCLLSSCCRCCVGGDVAAWGGVAVAATCCSTNVVILFSSVFTYRATMSSNSCHSAVYHFDSTPWVLVGSIRRGLFPAIGAVFHI